MMKIFEKHSDKFYFAFRVLVGLLFAQHGLQKIFGLLGGNVAETFSLMWFAGIIELAGGILIATGLLTRITALIAGVEMLVAFFRSHVPQGWIPIMNKGELALLFFAAFLILMSKGAGKWGLDNKFKK